MIEAYPVDFVNDPFRIAQNDNMVSINSALAVDSMGQIAATALGPMQYSGVGGQVDFVRGRPARREAGASSLCRLRRPKGLNRG